MSDDPSQTPRDHGAADGKHGGARNTAEAAMRAERQGDADRADLLMRQAEKADPSAAIDVVVERENAPIPTETTSAELAKMSETVQPGSDAPSRAGIGGSGSGADNQGL